jgi:hypothetical protein
MISGQIEGLPALQAELAALPVRLRGNLPDALQALVQHFRERMRIGGARRDKHASSRLETNLTETADSVVAVVSGATTDNAGARTPSASQGLRGRLADRRRAFRAPLGSGRRGANLAAALSDASASAEAALSPALADAVDGGGAA